MANSSVKSVIVVGGGVVGLCIAVAAQAAGHKVTLIARERPEDTASGIAAGMIAPALEAMNDPDPAMSFRRLTEAQDVWFDPVLGLPQPAQQLLRIMDDTPSYFLPTPGDDLTALHATQADVNPATDAERSFYGFAPDIEALRVTGDWALPARALLDHLVDHFIAIGGVWRDGVVETIERSRVRIRRSGWIEGDDVVAAAGFGGYALRRQIPSLKALTPIKGHLLDLPPHPKWVGVLRSRQGYLAATSGTTKFGATMQAGRDDRRVERDVVTHLANTAYAMLPGLAGLEHAVPRTGIRAASPDGWPMIGRDRASGVLVATAMRRNGYVFAPLAARMMLAFLAGETPPEAATYDPDRFG